MQMKFYEPSREKDRQEAWVLVRYLLFYMAYIFVLALSTYLMDNVFYWLGYGRIYPHENAILLYAFKFALFGYIAFPLSFGYNWIINQIMDYSILLRFALGISFSFIVGAWMDLKYQFGHYSGEQEQLKNVLAMILSGILVELLRSLVVSIRMRRTLRPPHV